MKKLLLAFLIFPVSGAIAQKYSIGIFLSPNSSYRRVSVGEDKTSSTAKKALFFDYGVSLRRTSKKNVSFNTGLNISNKGYDYKYNSVAPDRVVYSTHNVFTYLELPIGASYALLSKDKFRLNIGADFINQFLLQVSEKYYNVQMPPAYVNTTAKPPQDVTAKHSQLKDAGFETFSYGLGFNAEAQLKIFHGVWVSIAPTYKYSLKAYDPQHYHLYSLGAAFRISYEF